MSTIQHLVERIDRLISLCNGLLNLTRFHLTQGLASSHVLNDDVVRQSAVGRQDQMCIDGGAGALGRRKHPLGRDRT